MRGEDECDDGPLHSVVFASSVVFGSQPVRSNAERAASKRPGRSAIRASGDRSLTRLRVIETGCSGASSPSPAARTLVACRCPFLTGRRPTPATPRPTAGLAPAPVEFTVAGPGRAIKPAVTSASTHMDAISCCLKSGLRSAPAGATEHSRPSRTHPPGEPTPGGARGLPVSLAVPEDRSSATGQMAKEDLLGFSRAALEYVYRYLQ